MSGRGQLPHHQRCHGTGSAAASKSRGDCRLMDLLSKLAATTTRLLRGTKIALLRLADVDAGRPSRAHRAHAMVDSSCTANAPSRAKIRHV